MVQLSNQVFAARRAQWLAELSGALGEARRVLEAFDVPEARGKAMELRAQIDALRREVDALLTRRASRNAANFDQEWMKSPWHPVNPAPPKSGAGCEVQIDA